MKNDDINRIIKKSKTKKHKMPNGKSSWLKNVGKSLGYSAIDVLEEVIPGSIEFIQSASTNAQEAVTELKNMRSTQKRIGDALSKNVYAGIGKDIITNAIDDLRTGKINNKDREDNFYANDDSSFDFDIGGEEEYDSNFTSEDGSTTVTTTSKKDGKNDISIVDVDTNIGSSSPLVQSIDQLSINNLEGTRVLIDTIKSNQASNIQFNQIYQKSVLGSLSLINSNFDQLNSNIIPQLNQFASISMKFYDELMGRLDKMDKQREIAEEQSRTSDPYTAPKDPKPQTNVLDDIFGLSGTLNIKEYTKLVGKQASEYVDNNLVLSQMKGMLSQTDTLKFMAQNPLKFISDSVIKNLIPKMTKNVAKSFDEMLQETAITGLYRVKGLSRRYDNPILKAVGDIFGIKNKLTTSIDKSNYEKGKVEWNGIANRTLVDVIPFYLRKIAAALTGEAEIGFDYNNGIFKKVHDIVNDTENTNERRMLSEFSSTQSDFREFIDNNFTFTNTEQKNQLNETFKKFLKGLVKSDGGRTFRKYSINNGTEDVDDIAELTGLNSDDPTVQMIRGFFEGSKHGYTASVFGRQVLEAQNKYTKYMQNVEKDPYQYNMNYIKNGDTALDTHIKYDTKGREIGKNYSKLLTGRDKFNNSATDYSRRILKLLTSGLKVHVVNFSDMVTQRNIRGRASTQPNEFSRNILKDSQTTSDKLKTEQTRSLDEERRIRDQNNGRDLDDSQITRNTRRHRMAVDIRGLDSRYNVNSDQVKLLRSADIQREENNQLSEPTWLERIAGIGSDTALGKLSRKFTEYLEKPSKVMVDLFKKGDDFLFKLVFGDDGHQQAGSLIKRMFDNVQLQFKKFSTWLNDKILTPLYDSLFGEDGFINKLKQSQLGQDMSHAWENMKDNFFGIKDENGSRTGGLFSDTYNQVKDAGRYLAQQITGKEYTDSEGITHPAIENSVWSSMKSITSKGLNSIKNIFGIENSNEETPNVRLTLIDRMNNLWDTIKLRSSLMIDSIFGSADDPENTTRQVLGKFATEMKDAAPKLGASAILGAGAGIALGGLNVGFISSLFLPGGPIGGALLGLGLGIVTQSSQLKNWLFGDVDENGERIGGLVTKETQDFFKNNAKGMMIGSFAGLAGSMGFLPSLFVPGGPIGGALIGGAVSLALKNEQLQTLLYGEYDENGNKLKDGLFGTIKEKMGSSWNKGRFLDVGIGAGVGIMGSLFLPTGPILGAALGAATSIALTNEKFKTWMFGEEDPETRKRSGGLMGKVNTWMGENIFSPLKKTVLTAQVKVLGFIEQNMVNPLITALLPIKAEFLKIKDRITNGIKNAFIGFKDTLNNTFEKHFGEPIGEFMKIHLLNPLKGFLSKIFGGIGKLIGGIISTPFKLISAVGEGIYKKDKKVGSEEFFNDTIKDAFGFNKEKNKERKENDEHLGFVDRLKLIGKYLKKENRYEAQYSEKGAYYGHEYDRLKAELDKKSKEKMTEKLMAIENGTYTRKKKSKAKSNNEAPMTSINTIVSNSNAPNDTIQTSEPVQGTQLSFLPNNNQVPNNMISSNQTENSSILSNIQQSNFMPSMTPSNIETGEQLTIPTEHLQTIVRPTNSIITPSTPEPIENPSTVPIKVNNENATKEENPNISEGTQLSLFPDNINAPSVTSTPASEILSPRRNNNETPNETPSSLNFNSGSSSRADIQTSTKQNIGSLLAKIEKNVAIIADSTDHQLNGVGANVQKIFKILKKTNNITDEDVAGENNKSFRGFFGRVFDKLKHPMEALKDVIMTPLSVVKSLAGYAVEKVTGTIETIIKIPAIIGKGIGKFLGGLGKAFINLLEIPVNISKTLFVAAKAFLPVVAKGMMTVLDGISQGIRIAGSSILQGIKSVGNIIAEGAKGLGTLIGGALKGLGNLLYGAGLVAKDAVIGLGKGLVTISKFVGKGLLNTMMIPFKGIGLIGNFLGSMLHGKGKSKYKPNPNDIFYVYIKGGFIDGIKNIETPINSITNTSSNDETTISPRPSSSSSTPKSDTPYGEVHGSRESEISSRVPNNIIGASITIPHAIETTSSTPIKENESKHNTSEESELTPSTSPVTSETSSDEEKSKSPSFLESISIFSKIKERNEKKKEQKRQAEENRRLVSSNTYARQRERIEQENQEKSKTSYFSKLMSNVKGIHEQVAEHNLSWSSIFSKKGLLTGAILLGIAFLPKIIDWIKKLPETISGIIPAIGDSVIDSVKNWLFPDAGGQGKDEGRIDKEGNFIKNSGKQHAMTNLIAKTGAGVIDNISGFTKGKGGIISKTTAKLFGKSLKDKTPKIFIEAGDDYLGKTLTKKAAKKVNKKLQAEAVEGVLKTSAKNGKEFVAKLGKNLVGDGSTNKTIIQKFFSLLQQSVEHVLNSNFVRKFVNNKIVSKIISVLKPLFNNMAEYVTRTASKWLTKMGMAVAEDGSLLFPPLGAIVKVAFGTYDLLTGMTKSEAGRMFQISSDDVSVGMRLAGGISKLVVGLSALVDVASEICRAWTDGTGLKEVLAQLIYKGALEAGGFIGLNKEESLDKLNKAQQNHVNEFNAYNEQIQSEGKEPMSFAGYTDMVNEHIGTKINKGIGKAFKWKNEDGGTMTLTQKVGDSAKNYFNKNTPLAAFNNDNVRNKLGLSENQNIGWKEKLAVGLGGTLGMTTFGALNADNSSKLILNAGNKIIDAGKWTKDKLVEGYDWSKEKLSQGYDWTKQKLSDAKDWTIKTGKNYINNKTVFGAFNNDNVRNKLGLSEDTQINLQDRLSVGLSNMIERFTFGWIKGDDTVLNIYGSIEKFKTTINDMWKNISTAVSDFYTKTKDSIIGAITKVDTSLGNFLGLTDKDGKAIPLSGWISSIPQKISTTITDVKLYVEKLFTSAKNSVSDFYTKTKEGITGGINKVDKWIGSWFDLKSESGEELPISKFKESKPFKSFTYGITHIGDTVRTFYDDIKKTITDFFTKFKDGFSKGIESLDRWVGSWFGLKDGDKPMRITDFIKKGVSGIIQDIQTTVGDIGTSLTNIVKNLFGGEETENLAKTSILNRNKNTVSGNGELKPVYGNGDNNFTYYSQNDPKYKSKPYKLSTGMGDNNSNETIGSRGCGPTSLAMVASQLTGKKYDPEYMSNLAQQKGYSTQFGTNSNYFTGVSKQLGINSSELNPDLNALKANLQSGHPMIIQGASRDNSSPFTKSGHYVVATSTDGNTVSINDPRGRQYSKKYPLSSVLKNSNRMWAFGRGGYGENDENKEDADNSKTTWRLEKNDETKNLFSSFKDKISEYAKELPSKWSKDKIDENKVFKAVNQYGYELLVEHNPYPTLPSNLTNEEMTVFYKMLDEELAKYNKEKKKQDKKDAKTQKKMNEIRDTGLSEELESLPIETDYNGNLSLKSGQLTVAQVMPEIAKRYEGLPYLWGKAGPIEFDGKGYVANGFDCSGLASFATYMAGVKKYKRFTVSSITDKIGGTTPLPKSMDELEVGDFIFNNRKHMGIYAGDNTWVEAAGGYPTVDVQTPGIVVRKGDMNYLRSFKFNKYGRIPEADQPANVTNPEILAKLGDNFSVPIVKKKFKTADENKLLGGEEDTNMFSPVTNTISSIGDFFSSMIGIIGDNISEFIFGKKPETVDESGMPIDGSSYTSSDYINGNINELSNTPLSKSDKLFKMGKNASTILSGDTSTGEPEMDKYIETLPLSPVKKAIVAKTAKLTVLGESSGNYAQVANDIRATTGEKISPSIGLNQWRKGGAKNLLNEIYNRIPNDPEAHYFAKEVNWDNEKPWSQSEINRLKNFLIKNETINKQVQNPYAVETVKDNVNAVYKQGVDTNKIHDPRSVVFMSDIANTGRANLPKFFNNYTPTSAVGVGELKHVYDTITSYGGTWDNDIYNYRYDKAMSDLSAWQPPSNDASDTLGGFGEGKIEYNIPSKELQERSIIDKPITTGFETHGTPTDYTEKLQKQMEKIELSKTNNYTQVLNGTDFSSNDRLDRIINILERTFDVNSSINKGIVNLNNKPISTNASMSPVFGNGNVTNNNFIVADNNSNGNNNKSTNIARKTPSDTINRSIDFSKIELARQIAKGKMIV